MGRSLILSAAVLGASVQAAEVSLATARANPIRRVVTMIQNIKSKVEKEAERDQELHEKFMCYCKNGAGDLERSIAAAEAKIEAVASSMKEAQGHKTQLAAELVADKATRADAKEAIAKATAIRAEEAKAFAGSKAESETNIAALKKALAAIESGVAGSFLQTSGAEKVRQLVMAKDMSDDDRQDMMAFLAAGQGSESAAPSSQIIGILKQLGDEMAADLSEATAAEDSAIKSFDELVGAKTKEINAATAAIETKTTRFGEVSVSIAEKTGELGDTEDQLADDKKFLADLEKDCGSAQEKYDVIVKTRSEELLALSDTIKMLNDDDALELFKKAIPSASSLLQVKVGANIVRKRALHMIKEAHQPRFAFVALALEGKKVGLEKVVAMVDELVVVLKKEQVDDDSKKEYCEAEFDSSEDKKKQQEQAKSDTEAAMADSKETMETVTNEIKALKDGIAALDASVAEATAQRKAENEEYKTMMSQNTAAKDLIGMAKNRLQKFYNPKLYKAPPKRELSEEERIAVNMGETLAPTPAPGGIAGTGISAFEQESAEPGPAPAQASYKKSGEESGGVMALMDNLIKDLDKEMTVGEVDEKDAQADYETAMADAGKKRADDSKAVDDKTGAHAESEEVLQTQKDSHASVMRELKGTTEYIAGLHGECDWLLQNYDSRKEARTGEIDALGKAKAVLSGADYSLLQTRASRHLRGRD
jgi:chromosome segregation ATPase